MITFTPTCTFPTASLGFVQTPPIRGTMEIVWSCLSVIFLCTWSILHLKVPPQHRPKGWWQKKRWMFARFRQKLKWMVVTILAPEILLALVFVAFFSICKHTEELQKLAKKDEVPWSKTHSWFADQGGFFIHFPPKLWNSPATDSITSSSRLGSDESAVEMGSKEGQGLGLPNDPGTPYLNERQGKYDRRRARAIRKYGPLPGKPCDSFRKYVQEEASRLEEEGYAGDTEECLGHISDTWVVGSGQLLFLRTEGIIERLPKLEEEELQDRNKSDAVVKLLAIIQVFWLATQLATRAARGLPVTTLEISAVAYVASSLVTYLLQWDSIKDLTVPVCLEASRLPTKEQFVQNINLRGGTVVSLGIPTGPVFRNDRVQQWSSGEFALLYFIGLAGVGGLLFGGIHLAAWDFTFPSLPEQTLWRVSALVTVATPVLDALSYMVEDNYLDRPDTTNIVSAIIVLTIPVYVAARLFLLVESLRSLYFLPPAAYQTTWTKNAPHFG
ncbi:hypothetical protein RB595_004692 [Gaeumannomyces hyphopodioides]